MWNGIIHSTNREKYKSISINKASFQVFLKAWPNGFTKRHALLETALCSLEDGCLEYPRASTVTSKPQTVLHSHSCQPLQPGCEPARNLSGRVTLSSQQKWREEGCWDRKKSQIDQETAQSFHQTIPGTTMLDQASTIEKCIEPAIPVPIPKVLATLWCYLAISFGQALCGLALTCANLAEIKICMQVDATFSPFGHPTQVNVSWVTSIHCSLELNFFCDLHEFLVCLATQPSLYTSSTCSYLWILLARALH